MLRNHGERDSAIALSWELRVREGLEMQFMDVLDTFPEYWLLDSVMIGAIPICVFAACHIVKNYIAHLLNTKVPLILGIWGGKGQGKSFQTELIFQAMGIEPVIMSAGELESERAGTVDSLLIPFPLFLLGLFASMLLVL
ncbi:Ribulose bisphosphate carboxylase/oxygenase activase 2, chloroplastic [Vitis vinifera]|uniref:Ribulose bisphosphate carboxylase/oxygenase activase 2, chloroplastic n=1 Tax=Vitis vinifera TaxID=29760 RepID=A0A438EMW0_VITVI|nr:Ribulose bisphosphate carboxylase/oxygenase activase 2, chloroplastic [Vitis vinifera]